MSSKIKWNYSINNLPYTIVCVCTSMVGYKIHGNVFWAVIDFIFTPLIWAKWLILHEVTMSVIRDTFAWFFN